MLTDSHSDWPDFPQPRFDWLRAWSRKHLFENWAQSAAPICYGIRRSEQNWNPRPEFSYEYKRWIKSSNQNVKEHEWASDAIWPGYWRTNAKFPISYDYLTLKLLIDGKNLEGRGRSSNPCPNMTQTFGEENKMLLFYPYSSRTCRLRTGFFTSGD